MDKTKVAKTVLSTVAGFGVDAVVAGAFGAFGAGAIPIVRKVCVPAARVVTSWTLSDKVIRPGSDKIVDEAVAIANGEVDFKTLFL